MGYLLLILALVVLHWARIFFLKNFVRLCLWAKLPLEVAIWLYAILFLPGTMVHEMAHFLAATFLGLRTGSIMLLPEIKGKGVRFGSVEIEKSDPFRLFLVGIAPTLIGLIILIFIYRISALWSIYLSVSVASHLLPSREDLTYALPFMLLLGIVGLLWHTVEPGSFYSVISNGDRLIREIIRYNSNI